MPVDSKLAFFNVVEDQRLKDSYHSIQANAEELQNQLKQQQMAFYPHRQEYQEQTIQSNHCLLYYYKNQTV